MSNFERDDSANTGSVLEIKTTGLTTESAAATQSEGDEAGEELSLGFKYPDPGDQVTIAMIGKEEKEQGDWGRSEREVLDMAKEAIAAETPPDGVLIDAGCGAGRLIPEFEGLVGKIIAVEPDEARMRDAVSNTIEGGRQDKVEFQNVTIEEMQTKVPADVAVCSHIIQHIKPEQAQAVLTKLSDSMKKGGLLVLTTNYSQEEEDTYTKGSITDGKMVEETISPEEFAALTQNDQGILPIHWFSESTIKQMMGSAGFEIINQRAFHHSDNYPKGRDVFVLAKKTIEGNL